MDENRMDWAEDEVARRLLASTIPARLAYIWNDGTPRVVPIWFHWTGQELVLASPSGAPKMKVLADGQSVALTIDGDTMPYPVLMIRGTITVRSADGIPPEYVAAACRYMGKEQGLAWSEMLASRSMRMTRIGVTPTSVRILDFVTRFPSALA